jgi:hypothetical protein
MAPVVAPTLSDAQMVEHSEAIKIHEAGHAVARLLVAEQLGGRPTEYLSCVTLHQNGTASTLGQAFSKAMVDFLRACGISAASSHEIPSGTLSAMRASGIDIEGWYAAECLIAMFGPMAEAKYRNKSFDDIWTGFGASVDVALLAQSARLCGMSAPQFRASCKIHKPSVQRRFDEPGVWETIVAVAQGLRPGQTSGIEIALLARRKLRSLGNHL